MSAQQNESDDETISSGSLNMYGASYNNDDIYELSSDENECIHMCREKKANAKNDRPTWEEYFREIVCATSRRSSCSRLQVGCILVKDKRIISQGYNGFLPGCPHESIIRDGHEQATIHAEQNALCDCAKRGVSCYGSQAYITHYPCIICARLMLASGIKEIHYIADYRNDELVEVLCRQKGVKIYNLKT